MTTVTEIQDAVASLPSKDRAEIATFILEGLDEVHYWVEDEEVLRRAAEFDSGEEKGLTHNEFLQACGRA
ncbi:MAG: hypothetical protein AB8F34_01240 [Akkermansiaceae bacterium]